MEFVLPAGPVRELAVDAYKRKRELTANELSVLWRHIPELPEGEIRKLVGELRK